VCRRKSDKVQRNIKKRDMIYIYIYIKRERMIERERERKRERERDDLLIKHNLK
jgi:hypothetical protein